MQDEPDENRCHSRYCPELLSLSRIQNRCKSRSDPIFSEQSKNRCEKESVSGIGVKAAMIRFSLSNSPSQLKYLDQIVEYVIGVME